jgi:hypothetical protein
MNEFPVGPHSSLSGDIWKETCKKCLHQDQPLRHAEVMRLLDKKKIISGELESQKPAYFEAAVAKGLRILDEYAQEHTKGPLRDDFMAMWSLVTCIRGVLSLTSCLLGQTNGLGATR